MGDEILEALAGDRERKRARSEYAMNP